MTVRHYFSFAVLACVLGLGTLAHSQQSVELRKIVRRTNPIYPQIAKRMNLSGTVKVFAVVAPDGTVKSVEPVGGNPLLIQAAEDAIYKWKFVASSAESKEPVELHFDPQ
jgi:protein TonB